MTIENKRIKCKEIFDLLYKNNFLYKKKTITKRTVSTMLSNGFFESMIKDEISGFRTVLYSEVAQKINEQLV